RASRECGDDGQLSLRPPRSRGAARAIRQSRRDPGQQSSPPVDDETRVPQQVDGIPRMSNLYSRLAADFSANLDRVFAWLPDGRVLHYADVEAQSARYAHMLRDLGVGVGDRVAVQVEKSAEMLMLYLGCLRAGAV